MSEQTTSKLYAIVHCKCPHCRRGDIFTGSMYGWNIQHTKEICGHCAQRIEIEPGYFYAAMYVSYALNVAQIVITAILTYYLSGESESPMLYIGVIFSVIFLLAPFNYRYSRVILLHWLSPKVKYNPDYDK